MRKMHLGLGLVAVMAAAAPTKAEAQTANGTVNASALVLAQLQVSKVTDLAFGQIQPGNGAVVTPGTAPGAGQTMGVLQIDHNSDVIVSAAVPTGLSMSGAPDLPATFSCGYSNAASGALLGAATGCNSLPNRTGPGNGTLMTTYVQMGGTILGADTSTRIPGTYTGSVVFTVTATY